MKDEVISPLILCRPHDEGVTELADYSVAIRYYIKSKPGTSLQVLWRINEIIHKIMGHRIAFPRTEVLLLKGNNQKTEKSQQN